MRNHVSSMYRQHLSHPEGRHQPQREEGAQDIDDQLVRVPRVSKLAAQPTRQRDDAVKPAMLVALLQLLTSSHKGTGLHCNATL
jgi:hypothetical protein